MLLAQRHKQISHNIIIIVIGDAQLLLGMSTVFLVRYANTGFE